MLKEMATNEPVKALIRVKHVKPLRVNDRSVDAQLSPENIK